ncbi:glycosyltransferase [Polynucleobacter sp. 15G-AUS-farblos]|uniref:glycosyltransferase n=1 Tax=Polynucleobacter sp. 15G-AUS-farblos TaxID=2689094 RepID=UPI001C0CF1C3|nr:glycosyltransferase [Polynucleobacter sp. 15G-AUS-farblos]MBU3584117.1 glycosyltransferase [Polynucleobacter sp. 15G-AUS-farblos]
MLSIVTINWNNAAGLERTIDSLRSQSSSQFEWVFIDGNSTDDSCKLAQAFARIGDQMISESDTGIYNAMNKGARLANGSHVLFLNSGDVFVNTKAIERINADLQTEPDLLMYGFEVRGKVRMPKPVWRRFWSMPTSHQAMVLNRKILLSQPYDESYHFAADFEHFLRIYPGLTKTATIDHVLVVNEPYGSDQSLSQVLAEYRQALVRNGYPSVFASGICWIKSLYLGLVLR